jgi:hypothetical protein
MKNVKYFFFTPKKDIQASGEAYSQQESFSNMKFFSPFLGDHFGLPAYRFV